MIKHIVLQKPNKGTLTVRTLAQGVDMEQALKEARESDPSAFPIVENKVPTNRLFRNAWIKGNDKIDYDLAKAKEIHLVRVRRMRDKKLKELDVEQLKVMTDPTALAALEEQKQALRDMPSTLDLSKLDVNNPTRVWPKELELDIEYKRRV